jgi:hypothetical protein
VSGAAPSGFLRCELGTVSPSSGMGPRAGADSRGQRKKLGEFL